MQTCMVAKGAARRGVGTVVHLNGRNAIEDMKANVFFSRATFAVRVSGDYLMNDLSQTKRKELYT